MARYISEGEFAEMRQRGAFYEGYVVAVGYAYYSYVDPEGSFDHHTRCNGGSLLVQFLDVSQQAYTASLLGGEGDARRSSTHVAPHWKEEVADWPKSAKQDKNDIDKAENDLHPVVAFLNFLDKIRGNGDYLEDSRRFSSGTFLTLTSKNGGAGPAIHTQGAIKVKFVDADTLPGLMGLASGRGHFASRNLKYHHSQFLHRSNPAQSRLAELIEIVADVNELTKLIQHGKEIYSAADESRRNILRAGDEIFKINTDSALIRARSAQEMAVTGNGLESDSIYIKGYRRERVENVDQYGRVRSETWRTSVISEFQLVSPADTFETPTRKYEISSIKKKR